MVYVRKVLLHLYKDDLSDSSHPWAWVFRFTMTLPIRWANG